MLFSKYYQSAVFEPRRYRTLDNSLTGVRLGSSGRCIMITCDIHRPLWLVSMCGELQLVIVIGKISGFRNCLHYTARRGILSVIYYNSVCLFVMKCSNLYMTSLSNARRNFTDNFNNYL